MLSIQIVSVIKALLLPVDRIQHSFHLSSFHFHLQDIDLYTFTSHFHFQDIAFINPANVVFVYLLVRDCVDHNIVKETELQVNETLTCFPNIKLLS